MVTSHLNIKQFVFAFVFATVPGGDTGEPVRRQGGRVGAGQGLTLVHFSAQCKHLLWDALGA
jgi:hypothetical protein